MNYAARIAEYGKRDAEIVAEMNILSERRKKLALSALVRDKASVRAIQDIDSELEEFRREHQTLTDAIEETQRLQREHNAEQARKELEARECEARNIAGELLAVANEIDLTMKRLRESFSKREILARRLSETKTVPDHLILRMLQKFAPTCAARAAGLHDFISIEPVPVSQVRTLMQSSAIPQPSAAINADNPHAA
jgi:chromosome segregation ATPase